MAWMTRVLLQPSSRKRVRIRQVPLSAVCCGCSRSWAGGAPFAPPCAGPQSAAMPDAMHAKGLAWLEPARARCHSAGPTRDHRGPAAAQATAPGSRPISLSRRRLTDIHYLPCARWTWKHSARGPCAVPGSASHCTLALSHSLYAGHAKKREDEEQASGCGRWLGLRAAAHTFSSALACTGSTW